MIASINKSIDYRMFKADVVRIVLAILDKLARRTCLSKK